MAVMITVGDLAAAIRVGTSASETTEVTRLLNYGIAAVSRFLGDAYEDAPEAVVNEAVIRLAGYLYDMPDAGRGVGFAEPLRNSGALSIIAPYKVRRAARLDPEGG